MIGYSTFGSKLVEEWKLLAIDSLYKVTGIKLYGVIVLINTIVLVCS